MGYAHEYAHAILHRGRVPMEPTDFVPNWADRPRKGKYYPRRRGVRRCPAPGPAVHRRPDRPAAGQAPGRHGTPARPASPCRCSAAMLRDSYGLIGRRLGVQANTDLAGAAASTPTPTGRGARRPAAGSTRSASTGSPGRRPAHPGRLLLRRPPARRTAAAAGRRRHRPRCARRRSARRQAPDTDQFLLLGVKYWQNSFKYNSFSLPRGHAWTSAPLLQTWRIWARARGLRRRAGAVVRRARLSRTARRDAARRRASSRSSRCAGTGRRRRRTRPAHRPPAHRPVRPAPRPRTLPDAAGLRRRDRACTPRPGRAADRPRPGALAAAGRAARAGRRRPRRRCPRPAARRTPVCAGRCATGAAASAASTAGRPVTAAELVRGAGRLRRGRALAGDTDRPATCRLARLYVFVNHVEGVAPGATRTTRTAATAPGRPRAARATFLQRNYFLANYNLEQAGAVLVPTVRTTAVLDAVGDRGYRLPSAPRRRGRPGLLRGGRRPGPGLRGGPGLRQRLVHRAAGPDGTATRPRC